MEIEKTIGVERSFIQGSSAHAAVGRRDGLYEGNPPNGSTSILPKKAVKDSSKRMGPTARRILRILPE